MEGKYTITEITDIFPDFDEEKFKEYLKTEKQEKQPKIESYFL